MTPRRVASLSPEALRTAGPGFEVRIPGLDLDPAPAPAARKLRGTTYLITGRAPDRDGECVVCEEWVDASRHWEAVLLRRRGAEAGGWAAAHAKCVGGKYGGVNYRWRGPASIVVESRVSEDPPPAGAPGRPALAPIKATGPLVALSLEVIGDDQNALLRQHGMSPAFRVWAAEVLGPDPVYGVARRFLVGRKDYTRANSVGSRGVYLHYALERGRVYEVQSHPTWKGQRRYFLHITADGERVEMTREEALAWLAERSA